MQKRLLGAASLAGVAALLMSACGGSTPTPAATGDAAATTTTPAATSTTTGAPVRDASVDLVIWSDADRATILKKYADQFGQEQGIKVQIQVSTDVRKDFKAATDAGKGPDVIVGAHDWLGELVQNGAVEPVNLSADPAGQVHTRRDPGGEVQRPAVRRPLRHREPRPHAQHGAGPQRAGHVRGHDRQGQGSSKDPARRPTPSSSRSARPVTPTTPTRTSRPSAAASSR